MLAKRTELFFHVLSFVIQAQAAYSAEHVAERPHSLVSAMTAALPQSTYCKKEIQTRLALLSRPEFAAEEAYGTSALIKPKERQGQLWQPHAPRKY